MKPEDLMINNYINLIGKEVRVKGLLKLREREDMTWVQTDEFIDTKIIHAEPIKLNEQWLLDFGFESNEWLTNTKGDWDYIKDGDEFIFRIGCLQILYKGKIEYVHQLQNLYYALTGEPLKHKDE